MVPRQQHPIEIRILILLAPLLAALLGSATAGCRAEPHGGDPGTADSPAPTAIATTRPSIVLGRAPLCEASAALRAPWQPGLVLVADNEIGDRLFSLTTDDNGLLAGQDELALPGPTYVEDIEALAAVGERLLVIGSHGRRGKRCVDSPARREIQLLRWDPGSSRFEETGRISSGQQWRQHTGSLEACVAWLFTTPLPALAQQVCAAIIMAETNADAGDCRPLDIEAATAVPDPGAADQPRLWLGLRQPRFAERAVLLRLTPGLDELRCDGVVLLDVGDRGIRALESDDHFVWAILGPAPDATEHSSLWRAPLADLRPGATLRGEIVAEGLPPSSEGLVLGTGRVTILTDGAEPEDRGGPCEKPAFQLVVELHEP